MELPENIRKFTEGKKYRRESIGLSGGEVLVFDDYVLKAEPENKNTQSTVLIMKWLEGRLPVPKVICYETKGGRSFLLMSRINGKMACDEYYLERRDLLLRLLAEGLEMLWGTDIADCPRDRGLEAELEDARRNVECGRVDILQCSEDVFGKGGFENPEALLKWLENNKPPYEPVLSHGDYCLPNIFFNGERVSGFIDLGDCGKGDRYRDIALCIGSLKRNTDGSYGGKVYDGFDPEELFSYLGITPDREKLEYYMLLGELF